MLIVLTPSYYSQNPLAQLLNPDYFGDGTVGGSLCGFVRRVLTDGYRATQYVVDSIGQPFLAALVGLKNGLGQNNMTTDMAQALINGFRAGCYEGVLRIGEAQSLSELAVQAIKNTGTGIMAFFKSIPAILKSAVANTSVIGVGASISQALTAFGDQIAAIPFGGVLRQARDAEVIQPFVEFFTGLYFNRSIHHTQWGGRIEVLAEDA